MRSDVRIGTAMDSDTSKLFEEFDDAPRKTDPVPDVTIRPAREGDAGDVGRISAEREGMDTETVIAAVEKDLRDDSLGRTRVVLVAEVDGSVVGYGKARYRDGEEPQSGAGLPEGWYLTGVVVDPLFRRMGIGAKLTAARMRWIAERGSAAYYFANARNRVSIALHERFGFEEITRGPAFGREQFTGGEGVLFRAELQG
jgi:ribosomal protein S18 acetylase RimI-like enzyme